MRLAIIEDDPEITEVVSIAFETAWPSSQIVSAPNAVEGLEMIKNESPDSTWLCRKATPAVSTCARRYAPFPRYPSLW